ncbi:MAG: oxygenase MpaB family protein [Candidatus Dormibacteria bacterium]
MTPVQPARALVLRLLAAGLPEAGPFPLRSRLPEPGLFGPGSVTWQVMREPLLILGASRALLMQVAHPLVAQGALDHSDFATDPVGRFQRTAGWVTTVVFGTEDEAREATREVNRLHRRVAGELPLEHTTTRWPAGSPYRATDRDLLLWVHGSLLEAMLRTHAALVARLDEGTEDRFVREWDAVAALMGLPEGSTWPGARGMRAWLARQVGTRLAEPGDGSRRVAAVILQPRSRGFGPRGLTEISSFITCGLMPEPTRQQFGIRWSWAQELAFQGLALSLRRARPLLPRELRVSPVYDFAIARSTGELQRRPERAERLLRVLRIA